MDVLSNRKAEQNLKYLYGRQYGWAMQFRIKGKPTIALFPNEGYFVALIILNAGQLLAASQLHLHRNAIGLTPISWTPFYAADCLSEFCSYSAGVA